MDSTSQSIKGLSLNDVRAMLKVGCRLQQDAYEGNGRLLLKAGQRIETVAQVERLLDPDVEFRDVEPERERKTPVVEIAPESVPENLAILAQLSEDVHRAYQTKTSLVNDVKSVFASAGSNGTIDVALVQEAATALLDNVANDKGALFSLVQLKNASEYTFTHCVNVGITALHLAFTLGYTDHMEELGVGALLHDVGKSRIPLSILDKRGPLDPSERRVMTMHPSAGAAMLTQSGYDSVVGLACVRDHHETMIGTGYPAHKTSAQLSIYAMITAIADVYDALTTDRPYRKAMTPRQAMLLMTQQMAHHFEPGLLRGFARSMGYFPVGSIVQLSNGQIVVVTDHNPDDPLRPIVETLAGVGKANSVKIDLNSKPDLFVTGCVEDPGKLYETDEGLPQAA